MKIRIFSIDITNSKPVPILDPSESTYYSPPRPIKEVPVVRIFGSTPCGQTVCCHVHEVFPYFFVPFFPTRNQGDTVRTSIYATADEIDEFSSRMSAEVIRSCCVELGAALEQNLGGGQSKQGGREEQSGGDAKGDKDSARRPRSYVHSVSVVRGCPFYGCFPSDTLFFRIEMYHPYMIQKAAALLQKGAYRGMRLQPHEAHVPMHLQFMMDYCLYGMGYLSVDDRFVFFRKPLPPADAAPAFACSGRQRWEDCMSEGFEAAETQRSTSGGSFGERVDHMVYWDCPMSSAACMFTPACEKTGISDIEIDISSKYIRNVNAINGAELPKQNAAEAPVGLSSKCTSASPSFVMYLHSLREVWEQELQRNDGKKVEPVALVDSDRLTDVRSELNDVQRTAFLSIVNGLKKKSCSSVKISSPPLSVEDVASGRDSADLFLSVVHGLWSGSLSHHDISHSRHVPSREALFEASQIANIECASQADTDDSDSDAANMLEWMADLEDGCLLEQEQYSNDLFDELADIDVEEMDELTAVSQSAPGKHADGGVLSGEAQRLRPESLQSYRDQVAAQELQDLQAAAEEVSILLSESQKRAPVMRIPQVDGSSDDVFALLGEEQLKTKLSGRRSRHRSKRRSKSTTSSAVVDPASDSSSNGDDFQESHRRRRVQTSTLEVHEVSHRRVKEMRKRARRSTKERTHSREKASSSSHGGRREGIVSILPVSTRLLKKKKRKSVPIPQVLSAAEERVSSVVTVVNTDYSLPAADVIETERLQGDGPAPESQSRTSSSPVLSYLPSLHVDPDQSAACTGNDVCVEISSPVSGEGAEASSGCVSRELSMYRTGNSNEAKSPILGSDQFIPDSLSNEGGTPLTLHLSSSSVVTQSAESRHRISLPEEDSLSGSLVEQMMYTGLPPTRQDVAASISEYRESLFDRPFFGHMDPTEYIEDEKNQGVKGRKVASTYASILALQHNLGFEVPTHRTISELPPFYDGDVGSGHMEISGSVTCDSLMWARSPPSRDRIDRFVKKLKVAAGKQMKSKNKGSAMIQRLDQCGRLILVAAESKEGPVVQTPNWVSPDGDTSTEFGDSCAHSTNTTGSFRVSTESGFSDHGIIDDVVDPVDYEDDFGIGLNRSSNAMGVLDSLLGGTEGDQGDDEQTTLSPKYHEGMGFAARIYEHQYKDRRDHPGGTSTSHSQGGASAPDKASGSANTSFSTEKWNSGSDTVQTTNAAVTKRLEQREAGRTVTFSRQVTPPTPLHPKQVQENLTRKPTPLMVHNDCVKDNNHLRLVSIEMFAPSRGSLLPDPYFDAVSAIYCTLYSDTSCRYKPMDVSSLETICFTVSTDSVDFSFSPWTSKRLTDCKVYSSELDMFNGFKEHVKMVDPDILLGYEVQQSSVGYLVERYDILMQPLLKEKYGINFASLQHPLELLCHEWSRAYHYDMAKLERYLEQLGKSSTLWKDNGDIGNSGVSAPGAALSSNTPTALRSSNNTAGGSGVSKAPGRLRREDAWGQRQQSGIQIVGRLVLNVWRLMRSELKLNRYTFENVCFNLLRERYPAYSGQVLTKLYKTKEHRYIVDEYLSLRSRKNIQMLHSLDLINRTAELARIYGIEFEAVLTRGSQYRVESVMLRLARPRGYLAQSPSREQVANQRTIECLPLVLEPKAALYTDPVVVLDFQSLYPSIIIAYNICFSTCLGRLAALKHLAQGGTNQSNEKPANIDDDEEEEMVFDAAEFRRELDRQALRFGTLETYAAPLDFISEHSDDIVVSPNGVLFLQPNVRCGILPRMLAEILGTRVMVKRSMKTLDAADEVLQRVLNAQQFGLKMLANVTYGYTSASFSGRMPCSEIADSIVELGKMTLERAMKMVTEHPSWKAEVVYGDTDSMFVKLPGRSVDEAVRIGHEIEEFVTQRSPNPIRLQFEKVYRPSLLVTKKRYVGYMYEKEGQKRPILESKGIEIQRRDTCGLVVKMQEKCLRLLFERMDVSLVKAYVQRQFQKVLSNRIPIQEFIFAKEVRDLSSYAQDPPHVMVARRRMRRDARAIPRHGERVPYVVAYSKPGDRLLDMCIEPYTLLRSQGELRINAIYYITKQVVPSLDRLLNLFGVSSKLWYDEMPKSLRVSCFRPSNVQMAASESRSRTITSYFLSAHCILCDRLCSGILCETCVLDPAMAASVIVRELWSHDRRFQMLHTACMHCAHSSLAAIPCSSLDCPVFVDKVDATNAFRNYMGAAEATIPQQLPGFKMSLAMKWEW